MAAFVRLRVVESPLKDQRPQRNQLVQMRANPHHLLGPPRHRWDIVSSEDLRRSEAATKIALALDGPSPIPVMDKPYNEGGLNFISMRAIKV